MLDTTPQEVELKAGDGIKDLVFFNDRLPGIHLIKVDSADLSQPIANARFRFEAVDGSFGPVEYTTQEDGTIDLSPTSPLAHSVVTELECPGYVVDDAQRIIHLDGNEQAQFVFHQQQATQRSICIRRAAMGRPWAASPTAWPKSRTAPGIWTAPLLPAQERSPGRAWSRASTPCRRCPPCRITSWTPPSTMSSSSPARTAPSACKMTSRPNLTVVKRDADTGEPVADTVFLVEAADGHSVDEIKTGPDGTATLENLLPGVYEISEKSVPAPYLPDAPSQLVTLYPNRDRTAYFENHKRPTFTVQKENSITMIRSSMPSSISPGPATRRTPGSCGTWGLSRRMRRARSFWRASRTAG